MLGSKFIFSICLLETTVAFWEEKGVRKWFCVSFFCAYLVCGCFFAFQKEREESDRGEVQMSAEDSYKENENVCW